MVFVLAFFLDYFELAFIVIPLLRPVADSSGADTRYSRNLAIASNNLSFVLAKRDPALAERAAREAIEILERQRHTASSGVGHLHRICGRAG